jgi:hypothetical protein
MALLADDQLGGHVTQIMDCYNMNADGNVMRKRNEVHKQAESNRAYAHFRCAGPH